MSQIFIFSHFQTKKILIENTRVSEYIVVKIMTVGKIILSQRINIK